MNNDKEKKNTDQVKTSKPAFDESKILDEYESLTLIDNIIEFAGCNNYVVLYGLMAFIGTFATLSKSHPERIEAFCIKTAEPIFQYLKHYPDAVNATMLDSVNIYRKGTTHKAIQEVVAEMFGDKQKSATP